MIGKLENMLELHKFEARKIRERRIEPYCRNKLDGEKRLKDGLYKMWRQRAEWEYDNYQINMKNWNINMICGKMNLKISAGCE